MTTATADHPVPQTWPHRRWLQPAAVICLVLAMAGCQPFKPPPRTDDNRLPARFSLYSGDTAPYDRWWASFKDPELNALIDAALAGNYSIQEAWSRLDQARALAVQAGAGSVPDLSAEATLLEGRQRSGGDAPRSRGIEDAGIGLVSSYEIDLWGRVRSQQEAARLRVDATREDIHTAAVTIAAEVALRWVEIVTQRMQKQLLDQQLRTNRTLLDLVDLRFRKAMVSALDVYQQKQVVENILAEIPLVEQVEQLLMHELAVLLGKPPPAPVAISRSRLPDPAALPPTGLPADLLASRPDIRAAGLRLKAADWQIAEARANRLPALSLTARARYGEGDLDVLFDNWLASLAANLAAPLLDGGRRAAEVDRTRAVAAENLATYRNAVVTAVKEVEDALVSEAKQREHIDALRQVIATARRALEEAGVRYRNGLNDYLPVLTQLLSVQRLERDLINKRANLLKTRIALHRALGGRWPETLPPPAPAP